MMAGLSISLVLLFVTSIGLGAKCIDASNELEDSFVANGATCGILCAERAIFLQTDLEVPFDELIRPKYLSSPSGSTDSDLIAVLGDYGVAAKRKSGIGLGVLDQLSDPAILHVRKSIVSRKYNHWVLFLGKRNGEFLIADLPSAPVAFSGQELLAVWDGTAILTSDSDISESSFYITWFLFDFLPLASIAVIPVALCLFSLGKRHVRFGTGVLLCILLGATVGLVRNFTLEGGILYDTEAASSILRLNKPPTITGSSDVSVFGGAVAVDARFPADFRKGHVDCAVNIPVLSNTADISSKLQDVEKSQRIVVYCQSSGCSFSDTVAEDIAFAGYSDIVIFRPGWVGLEANK